MPVTRLAMEDYCVSLEMDIRNGYHICNSYELSTSHLSKLVNTPH